MLKPPISGKIITHKAEIVEIPKSVNDCRWHTTSMVTSKPAISGHPKTGQRRRVRDRVVLAFCLLVWQVRFGSPTARAALEDMAVMEQAIEHGGDRGTVAE